MQKKVISGWSGINNVSSHIAQSFQLRGPKAPLPVLVEATNVCFNGSGYAKHRRFMSLVDEALVQSAYYSDGVTLIKSTDTLYRVIGDSLEVVATGLDVDAKAVFHMFADSIFWACGDKTGRVLLSGANAGWGVPTCQTPFLSPVFGTLTPAKYLVSTTFVDKLGVEGAADESALITLTDASGILVEFPYADPSILFVRVYVTRPNGNILYLAKQVPATEVSTIIDNVWVSDTQIRSLLSNPPPTPANCLLSYKGYMLVCVDNTAYVSMPSNPHLYDVNTNIVGVPDAIIGGAGLATGFWLVTKNGAYWTAGETPEEWNMKRKSSLKFAGGGMIVDGELFPELKTSEKVAIFASQYGIVAGMPDGSIFPFTLDTYNIDVEGKEAHMAVDYYHGSYQLIVVLTE